MIVYMTEKFFANWKAILFKRWRIYQVWPTRSLRSIFFKLVILISLDQVSFDKTNVLLFLIQKKKIKKEAKRKKRKYKTETIIIITQKQSYILQLALPSNIIKLLPSFSQLHLWNILAFPAAIWVSLVSLNLERPMFPSYRNQSVDLKSKSIDWFLYNGNIGR